MIKLTRVSKAYKIKEGQKKIILDDVTMAIPRRNIGILGRNGMGKSTFLRMLAGIEDPDQGKITRDVVMSWPIGFRGSFHRELTGRENVRFVARVYGQNTEYVIDYVRDFAELGSFFDEPVKSYSSGMGARLAFGLSMAVKFQVYLIDELMSVGDARFQTKCKNVFQEKMAASNLIMVSHSMPALRDFCDLGIVVDNGTLTVYENLEDAIDKYDEINSVVGTE
jgi:capsular polysaccharide transport system ATP-binding protein